MTELNPIRLDEDLRALLAGHIGTDGSRYGSERGHRAAIRCTCGCGSLRRWTGLGDGIALLSGCERLVNLWVVDPDAHYRETRATR